MSCRFFIERIVLIGRSKQSLNTEDNRRNLEGRRPLILQNIEADAA